MFCRCLLLGALALLTASPVRAELVFFATGRALSVERYRIEGNTYVLSLRRGGEVVCDASVVERIEPDEVPHPAFEARELPPEFTTSDTRKADASEFDSLIQSVSATHGVDPKLVHAVIRVESAYQPRARSPKGAMGLMQLMPETARRYHVADPFDPVSNVEAGTRYLRSLLDRLPLRLALAAYNAGEGAVERFGGMPPYAETRVYVSRVLELVSR